MFFKLNSSNPPIFKPSYQFLAQAVFGTAFTYLTSGVFLSGLAILMGANDILVSYLSVTVNICGVMILAFAGCLERFKRRKPLAIWLTILNKLATLIIVTIPAFCPKKLQLVFFISTVIIAFTLQAQTTVVLNQWMLSFVNEKVRGKYIALRQTIALAVTVILSYIGGTFMDNNNGEYIGFVLLFVAASIIGILEILILLHTDEPCQYQTKTDARKNRDIVFLPFKNRRFTMFVAYILVFYLLLYISDSFTMVYMMKYLALDYQIVTMLYMIISLPQIILLSIWGKLSDKYGHKIVLNLSVWLFAGETFFLFFASEKSWFIFIPIAFVIASIANSGFVVAVFNRRYELMPKDNRIIYDNFYTAAIGIGFIIGPMLGGIIKNLVEASDIFSGAITHSGIRFLYLISTIGILLLQVAYLVFIKKQN